MKKGQGYDKVISVLYNIWRSDHFTDPRFQALQRWWWSHGGTGGKPGNGYQLSESGIDQEDTDHDCESNAYDKDNDNDGIPADQAECPYDSANDIDKDSICGNIDNCPYIFNPDQVNTDGNEIGDACECEADFDCDSDVDGTDISTFKLYFGRNSFNDPCNNLNPCKGDFKCDGDVDGTDAALFKQDFGRSPFNNPCPACTVGERCGY